MKTLNQINREAVEVLFREMGATDATRFLSMLATGIGNYTEERDKLFGHCDFQLLIGSRNHVTTHPDQCGGHPCIRGLRIRVVDVLDLLAAGLSREQILQELPDLEPEDISAAILYARNRIDH